MLGRQLFLYLSFISKTGEPGRMMSFKESETLEFKKSHAEIRDAIQSMAAMLNKHGHGEVIFGINDDGEVVGVDIGKMTTKDISREIKEHLHPEVFPTIQVETIGEKPCIRVTVNGNDAPYLAYGEARKRVGDKNLIMTPNEMKALVTKNNPHLFSWDDKPCPNAKLNDIDSEKLRVFLKKANLEFEAVDISLHKLGLLLSDGSLTNAAIVLFGTHPQSFFRYSGLRCAEFVGAATILDQKEYEGDLFELIENAQAYVKRYTRTGGRLEGLYMVDVPEIDPDALREAVVNAFCHRDYFMPETVDVAIYPDRVEIVSPGPLFGGLTIEHILAGGKPERRNRLLADVLHRIHMVEKWGRGLKIIMDKEPTAKFEESGRHFVTTFKRKARTPKPQEVPEYGIPPQPPQNRGEDVVEAWNKRGINVGEIEGKIIGQILANPRSSVNEISKSLAVSRRTVEDAVSRLKEKGILRRVGPKKGGRWEILKR